VARKVNCWEYMDCGRGPGSGRGDRLAECPAARDRRLDGTHGGERAGRACWLSAGTMCRSTVTGTFASKFKDCQVCPFFLQVKKEEHPHFKVSPTAVADLDFDL
jgi:hypothetical protein